MRRLNCERREWICRINYSRQYRVPRGLMVENWLPWFHTSPHRRRCDEGMSEEEVLPSVVSEGEEIHLSLEEFVQILEWVAMLENILLEEHPLRVFGCGLCFQEDKNNKTRIHKAKKYGRKETVIREEILCWRTKDKKDPSLVMSLEGYFTVKTNEITNKVLKEGQVLDIYSHGFSLYPHSRALKKLRNSCTGILKASKRPVS